MNKVDYRLNAIVDGSLRPLGPLAELARAAVRGGATIIQYRDKDASTRAMIDEACAILVALEGSDVPLVVNDRVDVALASGAHGVHLGRDDMDAVTARRLLGPAAVIGATVKTMADAEIVTLGPVDYACIGGVYETLSKHNPDPPLGVAGFAELRRRIGEAVPDLPVGAIAGIDEGRAREVVAAGASGVAVIGAIFRAPDIEAATRRLRSAVDAALQGQGR